MKRFGITMRNQRPSSTPVSSLTTLKIQITQQERENLKKKMGGAAETLLGKKKDVFILSGQSNMAGRGGVGPHKKWDHVVPPECEPHPSILRFSAKLKWEEAREPLHHDIDAHKTCGIGPGMPFARAVIDAGAAGVIGLVPCAVGGTAIREWERGGRLYESMVRRSKESVREGEGGEIRALLWYQGESDTLNRHVAETYKHNMERLISNVRSDLGLPYLPIIQVAIASGEESWLEKVREAQLSINLPNVICIDAKGLPLKEDHLHLTTEAQLQLGSMLAEAYVKYFASSSSSSSTSL